jgi:protein gp37
MSDGTKIEWTDATWNVVNGCSVLSPGCTNCYAMRLAGTRMRHHPSRQGLTVPSKAGPVWNGTVRFNDKVLLDPLKWRQPRRIFVCAHGDLFHDAVPNEWIDKVFAVMALAPQHQFQVLTKRAQRMRDYMIQPDRRTLVAYRFNACDGVSSEAKRRRANYPLNVWPLPNVWLGVSVEDQARADERILHLMATPAAVRWLSCEPLLGPVDLDAAWHGESALDSECWGECNWCRNGADFPPLHNCQRGQQEGGCWAEHPKGRSGVDWVVVGGESGPGARAIDPEWARSLRDQCAATGVPFLFKQWGEFSPTSDANGPYMMRTGKRAAGRLLDGQLHDAFPA